MNTNSIQALTLEQVVSLVVDRRENILLHGAGGCGKSYFARQLVKELGLQGLKVSCTASTGIAALTFSDNEDGIEAKTLHSWAGIGLGEGSSEKLYLNLLSTAKRAYHRWKTIDVLFLDELSMISAELWDKLDFIGRKIRDANYPFGGIRVVGIVDFMQLQPVKASWVFTSNAFLSMNWCPILFQTPMRYPDGKFFTLLQRARLGVCTPEDNAILSKRVIAYRQYCKYLETAGSDIVIKPTILYSTNANVDAINIKNLAELPDVEIRYHASDVFKQRKRKRRIIENDDAERSIVENIMNRHAVSVLALKKGAQVMITTNDPDGLYVNGSRGVIVDATPSAIIVRLKRTTITLSTHKFTVKSDTYKMERSQYPIKLAWASTIHKSQSMTLDYAIIDLGNEIFVSGQGYVAMSRVRELDGLFLQNYNPKKIYADPDALAYTQKLVETSKYEYIGKL